MNDNLLAALYVGFMFGFSVCAVIVVGTEALGWGIGIGLAVMIAVSIGVLYATGEVSPNEKERASSTDPRD